MILKKYTYTKHGVSLIEVVVGVGIVAAVIISTVYSIDRIRAVERKTTAIIRANYLLLEAIDVMKILRDNSWATNIALLSSGTKYYLEWDSGSWNATTTESVIDGIFYRSVTIADVNRDAGDDINTVGVNDPGTKHIVTTVEWLDRTGSSTRSFETYIMNLYGN